VNGAEHPGDRHRQGSRKKLKSGGNRQVLKTAAKHVELDQDEQPDYKSINALGTGKHHENRHEPVPLGLFAENARRRSAGDTQPDRRADSGHESRQCRTRQGNRNRVIHCEIHCLFCCLFHFETSLKQLKLIALFLIPG